MRGGVRQCINGAGERTRVSTTAEQAPRVTADLPDIRGRANPR
jgi:hypothetical protein